MKAKAMIIGPEETPYAFCPLVFDIVYPPDYPFSSPTVKIITTDGHTRFHPNLYVNGKVCLSILGTWKGPKWAPAMTISTVLSSIQSLLDNNPIVNEPGWENLTLADHKAKNYADFVHSRLTSMTIRNLSRWKDGNIPAEWAEFADVLSERGDELIAKLGGIIRAAAAADDIFYDGLVYSMSGKTDWKSLLEISTRLSA